VIGAVEEDRIALRADFVDELRLFPGLSLIAGVVLVGIAQRARKASLLRDGA
jgi:hypothetical protein